MLRLTIRTPEHDGFQDQGLSRVHVWRDPSEVVRAYGYVGRGARWMHWPGLVCFRFDDAGDIEAFPERLVDPSRIVDLCRRTVQPLVLQALGWETLHASAVSMPGGLVAFCGERESGKSTIAYALGLRGYPQRADDTVVFQVDGGEIAALVLPFDARLRPQASTFFGAVPHARRPQIDLEAVPTTAVSAIVVLRRVADSKPVAGRLTPALAFTAILAHAHCFDPEGQENRRRVLEHYLEIAGRVPVFDLAYSPGLERLDEVLACVEDAVPSLVGQPV